MAGLFDTLALGSRSLSTYRKAIDVTGHNLANVNTPGYTRQRLMIQSVTGASEIGPVGAGAEAVRVARLHNDFLDRQLQVESSVQGSLESREGALQQALTAMQESISRNGGAGASTNGISQGLADFFAAMQSLSTSPASVPERQVVLEKAQLLAARFNQVDARLAGLQSTLNDTVTSGVTQANALAREIAALNGAIAREEGLSDGSANDLRDARQVKLEALSRLVKIETAEQPNGAVNVTAAGVTLVEGVAISNTLEAFSSNGAVLVRAAGATEPLTLTGGAIEGSISVRDEEIAAVRGQVNALAEQLISEVNRIHSAGFSLTGSTGAAFFTGTGAGNIRVNADLLGNPGLLQASSAAGESGNNAVALALAQLGNNAQTALGGQTFSDRQAQIATGLAQRVAGAERDLQDQQAISTLVASQRASVSGVSLDEEMANLMMFQKAFQASAKLISMTDEMLATIIQM